MLPILLTEEDFRQSVKEATLLSLSDDNVVGEEEFAGHLARIVEVRNNELLDAEWLRRTQNRAADLPETSAVFADPESIARLNAKYVSDHAVAVAEKIARNKKIVAFVAGAVVAGAGFIASGGAATALIPALIPVARLVIAEMKGKDGEPLELPEVVMPQFKMKDAAVLAAMVGSKATGINAAVDRGDLPLASGSAASAGGTPTPPSGHHGDPHDLPAGHHDTTGQHKPGPTGHHSG